jgi:hypothetical protein
MMDSQMVRQRGWCDMAITRPFRPEFSAIVDKSQD